MGLAASQARFLSLTARKSDIEFNGQQVNQSRTQNAYNMGDLVNQLVNDPSMANTDPNKYNLIENQITLAQSIDRNYELDLKNIDTQHNEVQTEMDAVKKIIDKNVEVTFKTFA